MTLRTKLLGLLRNAKGNVLVLTGFAAPILIGFAGLATDTIQWTLDKRQLQRSADSAALAGAFALAQGEDAIDSADDNIGRTNRLTLVTTPVIENAPTAGSYAGDNNAVRVVLQTRRDLPFSSLFLASAPVIEVEATAAMLSNGNYCVISLDDTTDTGVTVIGTAEVDLNCGMFANSRGNSAVNAGGSSRVRSTPVAGVGGIPASDNYIGDTTLLPYSNPQPDPFSDLPDPETPNPCSPQLRVNPQNTVNVTPGCYRGMTINGTANFAPGVYYIDGGTLSFGAQAVVNGTGVTFILTSSNADTNPNQIADMSMNGGAEINLTAPTSGTYEGILVYQDRRADTGNTNTVNGNSNSSFSGAFYFASQDLLFNGTSGMTTDCVQFVANKVSFSGTTAIANSCTYDTTDNFRGTVVRLVE